jgi:hypothetical protein
MSAILIPRDPTMDGEVPFLRADRVSAIPLPVLLDVERAGELHTLLVTLEPQVFRVREGGYLEGWTGELRPDEMAIAKERLARAAREREPRAG